MPRVISIFCLLLIFSSVFGIAQSAFLSDIPPLQQKLHVTAPSDEGRNSLLGVDNTAAYEADSGDNRRFAVEHRPKYVPGEILVKFRADSTTSMKANLHRKHQAKTLSAIPRTGVQRVKIPTGESVDSFINKYKKDPSVEFAEPNKIFYAQRTPNDPKFSQLWGLDQSNDNDIDAPEAWNRETGNSVVIAHIDSGIDYLHEDLADNIWVNADEIPNNGIDDDGNGYIDDYRGWDFVGNDNDPTDERGHGTATAGIIAAIGNNGIGVTGVNWRARIMPLRFMGKDGSGTASDAAQAVLYASSMGIKISSNSWGCESDACFSQTLKEAIEIANARGMLFITAAGNNTTDNDKTPFYPCNYEIDNVICVAAIDRHGNRASASNFGAQSVDLAAPGQDILTTVPTSDCSACDPSGYTTLSGTSMATAYVSGAAALVLADKPTYSANEIKNSLMTTGSNSSVPSKTNSKLNVSNALNQEFHLSVAQNIIRIPAGESKTTTLKITFLNNYNSNVNISLSTATPGIDAVAASDTLSPKNNTATLTINTSADMDAGAYPLTVTAKDTHRTEKILITTMVETDLIVSDLIHPNEGTIGKWITVTDTATNVGQAHADDIFIHYFLSLDPTITTSDIPIGSRWISHLSSGESDSSPTTLWIPDWNNPSATQPPISTGRYYLGSIINKDDQVPEHNTDNNQLTSSTIEILATQNTPSIGWVNEGDSNEDTSGHHINKDGIGNIIVSGKITSDSRRNPSDYLTVKYDSEGRELWRKQYDNGEADEIIGQAVDGEGNIYVSGFSSNGTNDDYATLKYAPDGEVLWISRFDNKGDELARDLSVDDANNLFISGETTLQSDLPGLTVKYDHNGIETFVYNTRESAKSSVTDAQGNLYIASSKYLTKFSGDNKQLWERSTQNWPDSAKDATVREMQLDLEGNIYLAAQTRSDILQNRDYLLAKYDANGTLLWTASHDQYGREDNPHALAIANNGDSYIGGNSNDGFSDDIIVVKFDNDGHRLWAAAYDNGGLDQFGDLVIGKNGSIFITGHSCNELPGIDDCSSEVSSNNKIESGGWAATTIKYAPDDGTPLWISRYKNDQIKPLGLLIDNLGDILLTGIKQNASSSAAWTAQIPNQQPNTVLSPTGPSSGKIGETLIYSVSTTDPEQDSIQYSFDWGDDSTDTSSLLTSGEAASMEHIWTSPGEYSIKVRATDEYGNTSDWSPAFMVSIVNRPPLTPPAPSGPANGTSGEALSYSTSTTDPESDQVSYTFDWGDNTQDSSPLLDSNSPVTLSHRWQSAGAYQLKIQATDIHGSKSNWSPAKTINISSKDLNAPPSIPITPEGPNEGKAGIALNYSVSSIDPEEDQVKFLIDWGDGTSETTEFVASGESITLPHEWESEGEYELSAIAIDEHNNASEKSTPKLILILNPLQAPQVSPDDSDNNGGGGGGLFNLIGLLTLMVSTIMCRKNQRISSMY